MPTSTDDPEVLRRCRLYERTAAKWEKFHKRITEQLDFAFRLAHYKDREDENIKKDKTSDRIQPKGRELFQLIEHKAGLIARSGINLDVRPVNEGDDDPMIAKAAKAAMEYEIYSPRKRYAECRDRMVLGALATPAWAIEWAFNPDIGPFGEIVPREKDPRGIAWADGFLSMHDLECPWVMDWFWVSTASLKAKAGKPGWTIPDDLKGDAEPAAKERDSRLGGVRSDSHDQSEDEARNLVVRLWERGVNDVEKRPVPGSMVPLEEGQRFMACATCGFTSPTEEQYGQPFPENGPCPDCGAEMQRVDGVEAQADQYKWPGRKKMCMFLPKQKANVYEGGWPFDIPTVPFVYCVFKPHPAEPDGMSETSTNWTMQTASNMVLRTMLETALWAKPWMQTPRGYEDATGKPWAWGRDQGIGIYWTGLGQAQPIQAVQGAGIQSGSVALHQAIQAVFIPNMGRADIPLAPGESKDIAVGTVQRLIESGEIPTDHCIERLRRAEALGFLVLYHLIRKTYTPARVVRYQGLNGKWAMLPIHGDLLPEADIFVTAEPDFSRIQAQELQSIAEFAALPPPIQNFAAKLLNVDREAVAQLQAQNEMLGTTPTDLPLPLQRRMGGAFNGVAAQPNGAGQ